MLNQGYVQVYTGCGKGKTTAAIGQSIRALGAGNKVLFLQFMKVPNYSEHKILAQLAPGLTVKTWGKPCFIAKKEELPQEMVEQWQKTCIIFEQGKPPQDYVQLLQEGLAYAGEQIASGEYDLVVLDEINVAMGFELLKTEDVLAMLKKKHPRVEVVLTGRNCPQAVQEYADLVTEMREIKHYYEQGVDGRVGIES